MARAFRHEAFSFFTHLGGALLSVYGLHLLLKRARSDAADSAALVYGVALIAMFASSTLHHVRHEQQGPLRKLDLFAIHILVAATYTPIALLALPWPWSAFVLGAAWALAAGGIVLRLVRGDRLPRWAGVGVYVAEASVVLVAFEPMLEALSVWGMALLAAGALVLAIGGIMYAKKLPDPCPEYVGFHGVWHVMVLVGLAFHFALVWGLVGAA